MSLHHLVLFGLLAALALAVMDGAGKGRFGRFARASWPVYSKAVMTEAERHFYGRLCAAVPQFPVLCQVQLCRFVEVQNVRRRHEVLNRYDRLSADFLVCAGDYRPVLVVELDDVSHHRSAQRVRDAKKDAVLSAAGVPILRCRGLVSLERLREDVLRAIRAPGEHTDRLDGVGNRGRKLPYIGSL